MHQGFGIPTFPTLIQLHGTTITWHKTELLKSNNGRSALAMVFGIFVVHNQMIYISNLNRGPCISDLRALHEMLGYFQSGK